MRTTDKFVKFLNKKMPLPPDHVEGMKYHIEAFKPDPMLPVDWGFNRWEDFIDIIEVKLGKESGQKIRQLTDEGWTIINVHKGSTQLGLKEPTK